MHHTLILIGNLGKDPEMHYTPSGQAVCSFSVATSREYTSNDQRVKETVWFRVQTWGKLAETCNQYLKKGSKVYIEGRLVPDKETGNPRVWSKQDGTHGASFNVNAQTVRFLSPKSETPMTDAAQEVGGVEEEYPF